MESKYYPLPEFTQSYINNNELFFLFETTHCDSENFLSYLFLHPISILQSNDTISLEKKLLEINQLSKKYYLAGFLSYEAGEYFNLERQIKSSFPLLFFGVFDKPYIFNHKTGQWKNVPPQIHKKDKKTYKVKNKKFNLSYKQYEQHIKTIKTYIEKGETYQVNFTGQYQFPFSNNGIQFYNTLKKIQPVSYSAFFKIKKWQFLSFSPELFFRKKSNTIILRPMKGTIKRGKTNKEDEIQIQNLLASDKEKAENLMIVDLERNDLGKISEIGTVKVEKLFTIEKYNTLFQMTSEIRGQLKPHIQYSDIFKNLFPSGSVTGAPKKRTMEIIQLLEKNKRNVYCGTMGFIRPDDTAVFNIPIRTIMLHKNKGIMGVGSGITYSSNAKQEFLECKLKAQFLTTTPQDFYLIETMKLNNTIFFLKEHLNRLKSSAKYFQFYYNETEILKQIHKLVKENDGTTYKIRLLLSSQGQITLEKIKLLDKTNKSEKIAISKKRTDSQNRFLYHKTTNRLLYNKEYAKYSKKGFYDVLFFNEKKELTEGSRNNIFLLINKKWYTPALSSGVLNGVYRQFFIKKNNVKETILYKKHLYQAERIILTNSVQLEQEVTL